MEFNESIRNAVEGFLADWHRGDWMVNNGEWASSEWKDERETYTERVKALGEAIVDASAVDVPNAARADASSLAEVREALEAALGALEAAEDAAQALDGQVTPGDADHIAEGVIDPDGVAETARALRVGSNWKGWNCSEGWRAYRNGDALYLHWYRAVYGERLNRSLWVLVDDSFFEAD